MNNNNNNNNNDNIDQTYNNKRKSEDTNIDNNNKKRKVVDPEFRFKRIKPEDNKGIITSTTHFDSKIVEDRIKKKHQDS